MVYEAFRKERADSEALPLPGLSQACCRCQLPARRRCRGSVAQASPRDADLGAASLRSYKTRHWLALHLQRPARTAPLCRRCPPPWLRSSSPSHQAAFAPLWRMEPPKVSHPRASSACFHCWAAPSLWLGRSKT